MLYEPQKDIMYLRLSEEDDDDKGESCSIASQRTCIERYLQDRPDLGNDFEEIIDDGYSGTNFERPGMRRLLSMINKGLVRTIIVRDLSRFARNYLEAGYYLEIVFPTMGIRFISINDGFDSDELGEDTGGLDLAIRNLVNQMYSRDISRKIKSVVDMKKLNGEYAFGAVAYGYKKGEKHNTIVVDEPAAGIVRRIFNMAVKGNTITQIALALNEDKVETPSVYLASVRGKHKVRTFWTYESVRNILHNRIYTGDTEVFKSHVKRVGSNAVNIIPEELRQVVPDTHEAIISRTTFYLARRVVKKTAPKSPSGGKTSPLSSYLVCGCCGNRMSKGKQKNKTWLCTSARYTQNTDCANIRMDDKLLHDILLRAIQKQCEILDARAKQIRSTRRSAGTDHEFFRREFRRCKRIVEQAQQEKMRLYERYTDGALPKEDFIARKSEITARQEDAELQIGLLQQRLEEFEARDRSEASEIRSIEEHARFVGVTEITAELAEHLIKEIIIYPDNNLKIVWNFSDEIAKHLNGEYSAAENRSVLKAASL